MDMEYFKNSFRLISGSEKPFYHQLYDYFKRLIVTGILKEGDLMIPEVAICEELGVSRSTVRKAMDLLIADGLIERQRGKGTSVMSRKMKRSINYLYNFTENIRSIGAIPSSMVVECAVKRIEEVPKHILQALEISNKEDRVFKLHRIRCANGEPVLNEITYIPYLFCPDIEQIDFSYNSLYEVLNRQYMLKIHHATENFEAIIMGKEDLELLKCKKQMAGFKIWRISYLEDGMPYEYTTSVTRSDKCVFQMELYNNGMKNTVPIELNRSVVL